MLSKKKSQLAHTQIDFLGMHFKEGKYMPGPCIVQDLLNFRNENLSIK